MTLGEITDVMSEVGKEDPNLVQDRNVSLFIDKVIERSKIRDANQSAEKISVANKGGELQ